MTPPNPHPDHHAMSEQVRGEGVENPSAFPMGNPTDGGCDGMTLRDWFAGQALSGYVAKGMPLSVVSDPVIYHKALARSAYSVADAMLVARSAAEAARAQVQA